MAPRSLSSEIPAAAVQWIVGGDTGLSSKTIWSVLAGTKMADWPSVPLDPDDFGRCYRLLEAVPEWRDRLFEVALAHPSWAKLVDAWPELEAMWRAIGYTRRYDTTWDKDAAKRMYLRMGELIGRDRSRSSPPRSV